MNNRQARKLIKKYGWLFPRKLPGIQLPRIRSEEMVKKYFLKDKTFRRHVRAKSLEHGMWMYDLIKVQRMTKSVGVLFNDRFKYGVRDTPQNAVQVKGRLPHCDA